MRNDQTLAIAGIFTALGLTACAGNTPIGKLQAEMCHPTTKTGEVLGNAGKGALAGAAGRQADTTLGGAGFGALAGVVTGAAGDVVCPEESKRESEAAPAP